MYNNNNVKEKFIEIIYNAQKELSLLEPYKNYKLGEVYKDDNGKLFVYLCPSITQAGWGVFQRLDKKLITLMKKTEYKLDIKENGYREYSFNNTKIYLKSTY